MTLIADRLAWTTWSHVPGTTAAMILTPDGGTTLRVVDFGKYTALAIMAANEVLVGSGITRLEIVCADDALMSQNLKVVKDSGVIACTTIDNKQAFIECLAGDVMTASQTAEYVAARITVNNAGDKARVSYLATPRYPGVGLTASVLG